ncbi:MAG: hypothetical protein FWG56_02540 [Desulfovibrionaceae bacterium]|nr:hypothetical protein [Desulfovibrionaceae bacterium]
MTDTPDRATPQRAGDRVCDRLAPGQTIPAGHMYMLDDDGNAVPIAEGNSGSNYARAVAIKRACSADGDTMVEGAIGVFRFDNDATDPIELEDVIYGSLAGAIDGCTVSQGGLIDVGKVLDIDENGVWVRVGQWVY